MSLNRIIELDRKIDELRRKHYGYGVPEEVPKEIDNLITLLNAELVRIVPKLIRDVYRNFRIEIRPGYPVDPDEFEVKFDKALDYILASLVYVKKLKITDKYKASIYVEIANWDFNLALEHVAFEPLSYAVSYEGATTFDFTVDKKEVPLKWRSRITWKNNKLVGIVIYTA